VQLWESAVDGVRLISNLLPGIILSFFGNLVCKPDVSFTDSRAHHPFRVVVAFSEHNEVAKIAMRRRAYKFLDQFSGNVFCLKEGSTWIPFLCGSVTTAGLRWHPDGTKGF
jgi:hypothetical protein